VLKFLVESFKKIFTDNSEKKIEDDSGVPLKILQNFYREHEQIIPETLAPLSTYIIR
jgi:hypothetical protein